MEKRQKRIVLFAVMVVVSLALLALAVTGHVVAKMSWINLQVPLVLGMAFFVFSVSALRAERVKQKADRR